MSELGRWNSEFESQNSEPKVVIWKLELRSRSLVVRTWKSKFGILIAVIESRISWVEGRNLALGTQESEIETRKSVLRSWKSLLKAVASESETELGT